MPLPLLVYTAVLVVIALGGSDFFSSQAALPAAGLPAAAAVRGWRSARARPRAAAVAVVALAGISLGYGAYLC